MASSRDEIPEYKIFRKSRAKAADAIAAMDVFPGRQGATPVAATPTAQRLAQFF